MLLCPYLHSTCNDYGKFKWFRSHSQWRVIVSIVFVFKVLLDIAVYPCPLPHYAALLACRIDSLLTHSHDEVSSMHTAAIPIARWLCAGVAWLFFDCHYVNVPIYPSCSCSTCWRRLRVLLGAQLMARTSCSIINANRRHLL